MLLCCSAGAGRTGTFIALSNILERVKAEGLLDVFQTVKSLRMQRPHMVQTVVSSLPVVGLRRKVIIRAKQTSLVRVRGQHDLGEQSGCTKPNDILPW